MRTATRAAVFGAAVAVLCAAFVTSAMGYTMAPLVGYQNNGKFVLRKLDGTGTPKVLTTHSTTNGIHFSPGGEKVVLSEGRYDGAWTDILQIYDIPGGTLRTIYHGGTTYSPHFESWSPGGRYLIWTRLGSDYGYKYDCSARTSTRWLLGSKFRYSPDGRLIMFARGRQIWYQNVGDPSPGLLWDASSALPSDDFVMEWYDATHVRIGYDDGDWHVFSLATNGDIAVLTPAPSDWMHPRSRNGMWTLHADVQPATLTGPITQTVGPASMTADDGDVNSDGAWVAITDWWGGQGDWDVWRWTVGGTPTFLAHGFGATIRPDPLLTLGTPDVAARVPAGVRQSVQGYLWQATSEYPGYGTIRLVVQKRVGGSWQTYYYRPCVWGPDGWGSDIYSGWMTLSAGRWRVRASRLRDDSCPSVASAWRYVTVD